MICLKNISLILLKLFTNTTDFIFLNWIVLSYTEVHIAMYRQVPSSPTRTLYLGSQHNADCSSGIGARYRSIAGPRHPSCGNPLRPARRCCFRRAGHTDGRTYAVPLHRRLPLEANTVRMVDTSCYSNGSDSPQAWQRAVLLRATLSISTASHVPVCVSVHAGWLKAMGTQSLSWLHERGERTSS